MPTIAATLDGLAVLSANTTPAIGFINVYDATNGALSPTLPQLSGLVVGASMTVQKWLGDATGNAVTFTRNGGDQFQDGITSFALTRPGSLVTLEVVLIAGVKYWKVISYGFPEAQAGPPITGTGIVVSTGGVISYKTAPAGIVVGTTDAQDLSGKRESLAAGSATVPSLQVAPGLQLTTPTAGAVEFDGVVFYATPVANERHVLDMEQFITLTAAYALTSQTAAQKLFNSPTNGQVSLAVGTYFFDAFVALSALANSGAFGFALGGTAVLGSQLWSTEGNKAALATAAAAQHTMNTAANVAIVTATANTVGWFKVGGKIRVTTAGTVIPQISLGTAAAAQVAADSTFRIWPAGASGVQSVGNWS